MDQITPPKSVPGRTLSQRQGAAHRLEALRGAEEREYGVLRTRVKESRERSEGGRALASPRGATLSGALLRRLRCVDGPSELCCVDISDQRLNSVEPEDLKMFDNVAYVDASINSLSLGLFSGFVSLRELNLSLNGLCDMTFEAADFPHLQVLDLSYNSLSAADVVSIGRLPRLRVLHLTGNRLRHLPPHLGCSASARRPLEEETRFAALEVLMLDNNKLSSGVFHSLANLKRLRCLNLEGNRICEIPRLQSGGCSEASRTSPKERAEGGGDALPEHPGPDENFKIAPQPINDASPWICHKDECEEFLQAPGPPLPELQFLNLSDNKIAGEEALLAAALFPKLREIAIHSNPLTTRRSGDPPVLTYYLHERLGVTIKRKKIADAVKCRARVSTHPGWKMQDGVARESKKQMLVAERCEVTVEATPASESGNIRDETLREGAELFFVTQASDVPSHEFAPRAPEKETLEDEDRDEEGPFPERTSKTIAGVNPSLDMVEPIGIQTAVRMLEHALKNLNVYRNSKPKPDCIQTPYRQRQKRIKELPPLRSVSRRSERVDEMIKEMKERSTTRRTPLSGDGQARRDARRLLRDVQTKCKTLREGSVGRAAGVEPDGGGAGRNGV